MASSPQAAAGILLRQSPKILTPTGHSILKTLYGPSWARNSGGFRWQWSRECAVGIRHCEASRDGPGDEVAGDENIVVGAECAESVP